MTAVTAKWLDTRQKRSSRGISGEIDPLNGFVYRRWKKLELAVKEWTWCLLGVDVEKMTVRRGSYIGDGLAVPFSSSVQFDICDDSRACARPPFTDLDLLGEMSVSWLVALKK